MKLKLYTAASLIAIAGLVSCGGDNDKEVVDKTIIPTGTDTTPVQTAVPTSTAPGQVVIPGTTAPANTAAIPGSVTVPSGAIQPQTITMNPQNNQMVTNPQTITQTTAATAPGMNPPHGQPGHRCDISVGAPLNSKPAAPAAAQPVTANAQPQVTMKEIPTTAKTAPGMNPPHGEAGHRCDIAVGAPLNSKPAAPATVTTTAAPATISAPSLLSAPKSDSSKN